jgi:hypothetical protein
MRIQPMDLSMVEKISMVEKGINPWCVWEDEKMDKSK